MVKDILKQYLKNIHHRFSQGDAREESYYAGLEDLILDMADFIGKSRVDVTILPKKTEGGNPDFRVWDGKSKIIGYIESKNPETDLDDVENSEQLKRYRDTFPNLILTNFLEFRLYRDGQLTDKVFIGRRHTLVKVRAKPVVENEDKFLEIFDSYFSFTFPDNLNARRLAKELAKRTRFLKDQIIIEELKGQPDEGHNYILGFYEAFKKYLIFGLTEKDFADLYSQTITYGLFAARTRCEGEFHRKNAVDYIPQTIGILHDVFEFVSIGHPPKGLECIIDDITEVLASVNVSKILNEFYLDGKGDDPIIHFYETFLSQYDPKIREKRGVYYTPEPVVSFIVRSLNIILKEHFNKPDGLADINIKILDPAAGTLTFIAEAAKLALKEYTEKWGQGLKEDFVRNHLLKNFYAFELMMAPYAIGHLKMSYVLEEMGIPLKEEDRFNLYLTNTLEMKEIEQSHLPGMSTLSEESRLAGKVKKETPIMVILGNPPYSKSSSNKSKFIDREMGIYKEDVKSERNIQPLSDDYIKFIRFAHWKIDQTGLGVIGMITNNSYLSGLIHRGMREKLLKSFNKIYILNLHGNSRIGEKCPDGSKDENVFDIMQGVSIAFFIKSEKKEGNGKVRYYDIWGNRDNKYNSLFENDITSINWIDLKTSNPYYFFLYKDFSFKDLYDGFVPIKNIFRNFSSGVKTHRDHFLIGFNKNEVVTKINIFSGNLPENFVKENLKLKDTRDWNFKLSREEIKKIDWRDDIIKYLYRPFDVRHICYLQILIDRGCDRWDLMKNFFKDNIGIIADRTTSMNIPFNHIFISNTIVDVRSLPDYGGAPFIFPLYIYPETDKKSLFTDVEEQGSNPNIEPKIYHLICHGLHNQDIKPEEIFYYIYAVLYSTIYREKYVEFLRIDFPRIPFTSDYDLFIRLGKLGRQLADIHLMKSLHLNQTFSRFDVKGDKLVKKVKYVDTEKRVYINDTQYFSNIESEVWENQIGGYQVMSKWLKNRKNRKLSMEDIQHYIKISRALQLTIKYQQQIDEIYSKVEENTI